MKSKKIEIREKETDNTQEEHLVSGAENGYSIYTANIMEQFAAESQPEEDIYEEYYNNRFD